MPWPEGQVLAWLYKLSINQPTNIETNTKLDYDSNVVSKSGFRTGVLYLSPSLGL